jgi:hypothetical protein
MGTNAVSLPHTKNETSGSVYHALQLREQSARKTNEERTGAETFTGRPKLARNVALDWYNWKATGRQTCKLGNVFLLF